MTAALGLKPRVTEGSFSSRCRAAGGQGYNGFAVIVLRGGVGDCCEGSAFACDSILFAGGGSVDEQ